MASIKVNTLLYWQPMKLSQDGYDVLTPTSGKVTYCINVF